MNGQKINKLEKDIRQLKIKTSKILNCGNIPSYTQAELDAWEPSCPSLVYNSDTRTIYFWNGTGWVEVGGPDYVMVATPEGVSSGGTTELLIEHDSIEINPDEDNLAWTITMDWVAAVSNITGTATGISVGDTIGGKLIFGYKKVGGIASLIDVISDTRTGASSLVDNGSFMDYQIGGSEQLEIVFNGPTFAGGGTLDFVIKADIDITEVTW